MTFAAPPVPAARGSSPSSSMRRAAVLAVLLVLPLVLVAASGRAEWNELGPDSRMQIGFETHTRRALAEGSLPMWNPYHLGGRPHLADPATLTLYPPHVILRALVPLETLFTVSFVLHAWIFGTGVYVLGRQLGAPVAAAVLGSAGAVLGTLVDPGADLVYSTTVYSAAWVPAIVAFAMRSTRSRSLLPHAGLVVAGGMALTGPPRGQMFALSAIAACYVFAVLWPERSTRATLLKQGAVLAMLLGGLSAFVTAPHVHLRIGAASAGGLVRERVRLRPTYDSSGQTDRLLASAASASPGFRVLSQCREAVDGSRFLPLGVATVDGYGGAFLADYGRFASLVSDTRTLPAAAPATLTRPIRIDLLPLLNVDSVVTCQLSAAGRRPSDGDLRTVSVALDLLPTRLPRAFWTCSPVRLTRDELVHLLENFRYDESLRFRSANPIVHVRWAGGVDAPARTAAESALKLRVRRYVDGTTWQYDLLDSTRANLAALVGHPAVVDTAGFERGALALPAPPELPSPSGSGSEWILGVGECGDPRPATIERLDTAAGHFVATIDAPRAGVLFISETFSPLRSAWVDGNRVDALKVNYAFTAVPVLAGLHRIELRAESRSFIVGLVTTAATLAGWIAFTWMPRRP